MRVALSAGVPILRYTAGVSIPCCSAGVSIFRYTWIRSHFFTKKIISLEMIETPVVLADIPISSG